MDNAKYVTQYINIDLLFFYNNKKKYRILKEEYKVQ